MIPQNCRWPGNRTVSYHTAHVTWKYLASFVALLALTSVSPAEAGGYLQSGQAQNDRPKKVDIVSVTGCLREQGSNNWVVVAATEPVVSSANAPLKSEIPTTAVTGKNQFKLIGVAEFNLPNYRNQTVVIKGLHIQAAPVDRLNVTSITTAVTFCAEGAPK
jgi:hypothetical protein